MRKNIRNYKQQKKLDKGITLIALIITIIIIIILSSIAISLISGENGILSKAIIAEKEYKEAQEIESNRINQIDNQMLASSRGAITVDEATLNNLIDQRIQLALSNIGTYYTNNATVTCNASTETTNIASVTVPKGSYFVQTQIQIQSQTTTTGFLQNKILTSGSVSYNNARYSRSYNQNGGWVFLPNQAYIVCDDDTTITLAASNWNSFSASVNGIINATKIK